LAFPIDIAEIPLKVVEVTETLGKFVKFFVKPQQTNLSNDYEISYISRCISSHKRSQLMKKTMKDSCELIKTKKRFEAGDDNWYKAVEMHSRHSLVY